MTEKFDPSKPEYKQVKDLPKNQRKNFRDVSKEGFVMGSTKNLNQLTNAEVLPLPHGVGDDQYEELRTIKFDENSKKYTIELEIRRFETGNIGHGWNVEDTKILSYDTYKAAMDAFNSENFLSLNAKAEYFFTVEPTL